MQALRFYQPSIEESFIDAIFVHCAQTAGGDLDVYRFIKFRHENAFLLQVRVFSHFAGRVELGGAGAIAISAPYD